MSETVRDCLVCKKSFVIKTFDKTRAKYCSKKCQKSIRSDYDKSLPSNVEISCLSCGKQFTVWRSQSNRKYCSQACKKKHWSESGSTTGFLDLTDQEFDRVTVLGYAGHFYGTHNAWHCRCDCGNYFTTTTNSLRAGSTRSCGCLARREGIEKPTIYVCTKCHLEFPYSPEFFHESKSFRWGMAPWCHNCYRPILRRRHLAFRKKLKLEILTHYSKGTPFCECCGVTGVEFLTLDHINNDGKADRKIHGVGTQFYARMKRLGFPPNLRVLCWNCNIARSQSPDNICPHQKLKT
jgi:hypothetical protein